MNLELIAQYNHYWRVFERLVAEFDDQTWIHTGRKATIPVKLSFHILKATKYYIEDTTGTTFASGKSFDANPETTEVPDLPSRDDILQCIKEFKQKTADWLSCMELASKNETFGWAGKTKLGVVIFLLKHNTYHLGELSSLLNESRNGEVEDNYVKALNES